MLGEKVLILSGVAILTACGGGDGGSSNVSSSSSSSSSSAISSSSSSESSSSSPVSAQMGSLVVVPVEGLQFTSGMVNGLTSSSGGFEYQDGESVTFSIGDLRFPVVLGGEEVSPFTLAGAGDTDNRIVLNITRLLMALDEDNNTANGIQVPTSAAAMATGLSVDWADTDFDTAVLNFVANAGGGGVLPSDQLALEYLAQSLGGSADCSAYPQAGTVANLITRAHAVEGSVTVVDDCTLLISHFSYDGGGLPDVYFYGTDSDTFTGGYTLGDNLFGQAYSDATFIVSVSPSLSASMRAISVWCLGVSVSFGDAAFE